MTTRHHWADQNDQSTEATDLRTTRSSMVVPRASHPALAPHRLPDLFCPFETRINPWVDEAHEQSLRWALSLGLVEEGAAVAKLERARLTHLEARAFPDASREALGLLGKWVTLFCAIDDFVESSRLGTLELSAYLAEALAAFGGRATSTDVIVRGFHGFGVELLEITGSKVKDQFCRELELLFSAYVWEEINRHHLAYPDYAGYRTLRATTIGLRPHFLIAKALGPGGVDGSGDDLSLLKELERAACLIVGWANDIFTYQKELTQGEGHNLVAILMRTEELPLWAALERASALHDQEVCSFLALQSRLEQSATMSAALTYRIAHLQHWIGGHMDWAAQNGRYRPTTPPPDIGQLNRI